MMFSIVKTCPCVARFLFPSHPDPRHPSQLHVTSSTTLCLLFFYNPSTSTTTATSYLYILFAITFKLVCILILKRTSNHIFGPGSWLCVNAGGEGLFDVVMAGWLPPQYYWICRPLSCPKGIVLAALLITLSTEREREMEKIKTPTGHE